MPQIIMPIGIPSAGKSTIRVKYMQKYPSLCVVSPDDIRGRLLDSEHTKKYHDPTIEPQVWKEVNDTIDACVKENRTIFLDATNTQKTERKLTFDRLPKQYTRHALFFHIDPEVAFLRQKQRERFVPKHVMYSYHFNLNPPTKNEFDQIDVISKRASPKECKELRGYYDIDKKCTLTRLI